MKKILFLGSKPIGHACLSFLIDHKFDLDCEIVGVLSNDNKRFDSSQSIKDLADSSSIPFIEDLDSILKLRNVDYIISVQYHLILKKNHVEVARELAINLHMAPLPDYRGCNQFSFAIYNRAKEFGTTLHRIETGIDSGAIIAEKRFVLEEGVNVEALYKKTFVESKKLFENNIKQILRGDYNLVKQSDLEAERGTNIYFRKDIEKLKEINLNDCAENIIKAVRATSMPGFEPPFSIVDGKKYYIVPADHYDFKK